MQYVQGGRNRHLRCFGTIRLTVNLQPQAQSHRNTQRSRLPLSAAMAGPTPWRGRYVETPCGRWGICCKETVDELEAERELEMGQMVMCFVVGQMVLSCCCIFVCVCECV